MEMNEGKITVGRPCDVCRSMKRSEIEDAIYSNRPISQISQSNGISSHSIYRHIRNHAAPDLQRAFRSTVEMNTASLVSRIMDIADAARTIRVEASSETVSLQAGAAELRTLSTLIARLGVESTAMADLAKDATVLADVTAALAKGNRAFGEALVQHLAERGAEEMAAAVSASLTETDQRPLAASEQESRTT
ncbi:hypothetical protein [Leucobacter alluvii]